MRPLIGKAMMLIRRLPSDFLVGDAHAAPASYPIVGRALQRRAASFVRVRHVPDRALVNRAA